MMQVPVFLANLKFTRLRCGDNRNWRFRCWCDIIHMSFVPGIDETESIMFKREIGSGTVTL